MKTKKLTIYAVSDMNIKLVKPLSAELRIVAGDSFLVGTKSDLTDQILNKQEKYYKQTLSVIQKSSAIRPAK